MKKKFTLIGGLLMATAAMAQQDSSQVLSHFVLEGEKRAKLFLASGRDVQYITKEELKAMPIKSINEALSYIGGVDVRQRGPFGTQADVSMDGGTFEQTLILIDGIKIIDSQTAHNAMNIPVPLDAVERIEILRGPAARIYGINALTGAINIVTDKSEQSSLSVHAYGGSSFKQKDAGDGEGIYAGGGVQLSANYSTKKTSHLFAFSKDLYNGQRYNSAFDNNRFFYKGKFTTAKRNTYQWMGGYVGSDFGANGFYAAPGDINSREIVKTAIASLSASHQLSQKIALKSQVNGRYNEDDYRYFGDNLNAGRSMHYSSSLAALVNAEYYAKFGTFLLGVESRIDDINSSNIGKHTRNNQGAYLEYKSVFAQKIITSVGVYVNYNSNFGWQAFPGLDLSYWLNDHWKIAANTGSSQRIPSFTDLYLKQLPGNIGNPALQSENAWQHQVFVAYQNDNKLRFKVGYFYRDISNFIDWVREDVSQPFQATNYGHNYMHGFNVNASRTWALSEKQSVGLRGSYNYLKPKTVDHEDSKISKYVLENLKHQVIFGLDYKYNNFSFQWNNRFNQRELNDGYYFLDLKLGYGWKKVQVHVDVNNLFDADYKEVGAVPIPGRWVSAGVKYKFMLKQK